MILFADFGTLLWTLLINLARYRTVACSGEGKKRRAERLPGKPFRMSVKSDFYQSITILPCQLLLKPKLTEGHSLMEDHCFRKERIASALQLPAQIGQTPCVAAPPAIPRAARKDALLDACSRQIVRRRLRSCSSRGRFPGMRGMAAVMKKGVGCIAASGRGFGIQSGTRNRPTDWQERRCRVLAAEDIRSQPCQKSPTPAAGREIAPGSD